MKERIEMGEQKSFTEKKGNSRSQPTSKCNLIYNQLNESSLKAFYPFIQDSLKSHPTTGIEFN
jgi:hypothetical protein